jgi:hypothetical protein
MGWKDAPVVDLDRTPAWAKAPLAYDEPTSQQRPLPSRGLRRQPEVIQQPQPSAELPAGQQQAPAQPAKREVEFQGAIYRFPAEFDDVKVGKWFEQKLAKDKQDRQAKRLESGDQRLADSWEKGGAAVNPTTFAGAPPAAAQPPTTSPVPLPTVSPAAGAVQSGRTPGVYSVHTGNIDPRVPGTSGRMPGAALGGQQAAVKPIQTQPTQASEPELTPEEKLVREDMDNLQKAIRERVVGGAGPMKQSGMESWGLKFGVGDDLDEATAQKIVSKSSPLLDNKQTVKLAQKMDRLYRIARADLLEQFNDVELRARVPKEDRDLYLGVLQDLGDKNAPELGPVDKFTTRLARGIEGTFTGPERTMFELLPGDASKEQQEAYRWLSTRQQIKGGALPATSENLFARGLYAAAEMAPPMAASALTFKGTQGAVGTAGAYAGQAAFWGSMEFPGLVDELRTAGASDTQAKTASAIASPVIGLIELWEGPWKAMGLGTATKALVRRAAKKAAVEFFKSYGKEWGEEVAQAGVRYVTKETLAAIDPQVPVDRKQEWENAKRGLTDAALALPFMMAPGGAMNVARGVRTDIEHNVGYELLAEHRATQQQTIKDLLQPAGAAAWVQSHPEAATALVDAADAAENGVPPRSVWRTLKDVPKSRGGDSRKAFADVVRGVLAQPGGGQGTTPVGSVPREAGVPVTDQQGDTAAVAPGGQTRTPAVEPTAPPVVPPVATESPAVEPTGQAGEGGVASEQDQDDQADWQTVLSYGGVDAVTDVLDEKLREVGSRGDPEIIKKIDLDIQRLNYLVGKFGKPTSEDTGVPGQVAPGTSAQAPPPAVPQPSLQPTGPAGEGGVAANRPDDVIQDRLDPETADFRRNYIRGMDDAEFSEAWAGWTKAKNPFRDHMLELLRDELAERGSRLSDPESPLPPAATPPSQQPTTTPDAAGVATAGQESATDEDSAFGGALDAWMSDKEAEKPAEAAPNVDQLLTDLEQSSGKGWQDVHTDLAYDPTPKNIKRAQDHLAAHPARPVPRADQAEFVIPGSAESGRHRGATISPSAKQPGKFQVTEFDDDGFSGDRTYNTREEALKDLRREGFDLTDEGHLDKMQVSAYLIGMLNELGAVRDEQGEFIDTHTAIVGAYKQGGKDGLKAANEEFKRLKGIKAKGFKAKPFKGEMSEGRRRAREKFMARNPDGPQQFRSFDDSGPVASPVASPADKPGRGRAKPEKPVAAPVAPAVEPAAPVVLVATEIKITKDTATATLHEIADGLGIKNHGNWPRKKLMAKIQIKRQTKIDAPIQAAETRAKNKGIREQANVNVESGDPAKIGENEIVYTPVGKLPSELRKVIQDYAQYLIDYSASLGSARGKPVQTALQKIIKDAGSDTGSEVEAQKQKIVDHLTGGTDTAAGPQVFHPIVSLFVTEPKQRTTDAQEAIDSVKAGEPNDLAQFVWEALDDSNSESLGVSDSISPEVTDEDVIEYLAAVGGVEVPKVKAAIQKAISGFEAEAANIEAAEQRKRANSEIENLGGKQGTLFGKKGEPGQKNLFADKGVPEDMVGNKPGEPPAAPPAPKPPAPAPAPAPVEGSLSPEDFADIFANPESAPAPSPPSGPSKGRPRSKTQRNAAEPSKGTKKSPKEGVAEGIAEAKAGADLILKGLKDLGTTFTSGPPINADIACGMGMVANGLIKAGKYKFQEFIEEVVKLIGKPAVKYLGAHLEAGWNKKGEADSRLDKATSVAEMLAEAPKEKPASPPAEPSPEPESDADKTLRQAGLIVEKLPTGTWQITGNTYEHSKEIGNAKREVPELGGWWNRDEKRWTFKRDPRRAIADRIVGAGTQEEPADAKIRDEQVAREESRAREDAKPDVQRTRGDYAASVDQTTKDLIARGLKHDIPQNVVDNQIEDVGRVVDAAEAGRPMFVVGSAPGTGKTFVLGGVIRELRNRGFKRFVYVTQNQNLISQVSENLADYGLEGVEFTTYAKVRETPADTSGVVLLLDEAHSAKNTDRNTGKVVNGMVQNARFTVYASATPFENVTEAEYLGYSKIFDDLHVEFDRPSNRPGKPFHNTLDGFDAWAWMFGANVYFIKKQDRRGNDYLVPVLWWPKHQTAEEDQFAANEWLQKRGVYVQRPMTLPAGTVNSEMRAVEVDKFWADISNQAVQIYADATETAESDMEKGQINAHKVNVLKRLLEAAKVDATIARAKELIGEGRPDDPQAIVFVNTKQDLNLGDFTLSEPYRKHHNIKGAEAKRRYKPAEMDRMMQEHEQAANAAEMMGEGRSSVGPPPFARFIHKIAMAMDRAGVLKKLPSVIDKIMEAFPSQAVEFSGRMSEAQNQANLAKWKDNKAKLIVATMDKGGTGLSFHDTTGKMPSRYQVNMNLPWSGTKVEQVSGRLARLGTAKPVTLEWIFAKNIPFDQELSRTVGSRMRSMSAAVQGKKSGDAKRVRDFDFEDPDAVVPVAPATDIPADLRQQVANGQERVRWGGGYQGSDANHRAFATIISSALQEHGIGQADASEAARDILNGDATLDDVWNTVKSAPVTPDTIDSASTYKEKRTKRTIGNQQKTVAIRTFTGTTSEEFDAFLDSRSEVEGVTMRQKPFNPMWKDPDGGNMKLSSYEYVVEDQTNDVSPDAAVMSKKKLFAVGDTVKTYEHGDVEILEVIHKNWGLGKINGQWAAVNLHTGTVDPQMSYDKTRILERFALAGLAAPEPESKPTGNKAKAAAESKKMGEAVDRIFGAGKGNQPGALGLNKDMIVAIADLMKATVKKGRYEFQAFVESVVEKFGRQFAIDNARDLRTMWDDVRKRLPKMGESSDVAEMLAEAAQPPVEESAPPVEEPAAEKPKPRKPAPAGDGGTTTGTKKVKTEELREEHGFGKRVFDEWKPPEAYHEEAMQIYADDPQKAVDLARDVSTGNKQTSPLQDALLKVYANDLENRSHAGEDVRKEMWTAIVASEKSGTVWSQWGHERQRELASDFSLQALVRKHENTVGKKPTEKQWAEYEELAAKYEQALADNKDIREKLAQEAAARAVAEAALKEANAKRPVGPMGHPGGGSKGTVEKAKDRAKKAAANISDKFKNLFALGAVADPKLTREREFLAAVIEGIRAYTDLVRVQTLTGFRAWLKNEAGVDVDKTSDLIRKAWDQEMGEGTIDTPEVDANNTEQVRELAQQILTDVVKSGITETDAAIDAVHAELQNYVPGITRSESREALSGYGDYTPLSTDPVKQTVRKIKGESQQLTKIEILQKAIVRIRELKAEGKTNDEISAILEKDQLYLKPTGLQRREVSPDESDLIEQVNELKKQMPVTVKDRAGRLRSARGAAKKAASNQLRKLGNEIEALKKSIAEKTELAKSLDKTALVPDEELTAAREQVSEKTKQRNELKSEYQKLFPPSKERKTLTEAQQIAAAERLLDLVIKQTETDLAARRLEGPFKGTKLESPGLTERRARLQELRDHRDELREASPEYQAKMAERRAKAKENSLDRRIKELSDDLSAGRLRPETPTSNPPMTTAEIESKTKELAKLIADREKRREVDPSYQAEEELLWTQRYKRQQAKRLEFWEKRLAEAKKGKNPVKRQRKTKLDKEATDNNIKIARVQEEAELAIENNRRAALNIGQKIYEGLQEGTSLFPRTMMAGLEMSIFFKQAWFYTHSHPIKAVVNLAQSIPTIFVERIAASRFEDVHKRVNSKNGDYATADIDFTEKTGPIPVLEEMYASALVRWASHLEGPLLFPVRFVANGYMMMERAVRSFGNVMRADLYDIMKEDTQNIREFFGQQNLWTEVDMKEQGKGINIFSGRGTGLKERSRLAEWLVFSRRWAWSRIQALYILPIQLMTPKQLGQFKGDAAMRLSYAKLYAQALAGFATYHTAMFWLNWLMAGDDEDKKPKIEWDMRSTDFLNQRIGDVRIDRMGGEQQPLVLAARIARSSVKTSSGEIRSIYGEDVKFCQDDAAEIILKYILSKAGPGPGLVLELASGRERITGDPISPAMSAFEHVTPMTYGDILEAEKQLNLPQGIVMALEAFLGQTLKVYGPMTDYLNANEEEKQKILKEWHDITRGVGMPQKQSAETAERYQGRLATWRAEQAAAAAALKSVAKLKK